MFNLSGEFIITEKLGKPVRNSFRTGAKIIEWIAVVFAASVIFENLGIFKAISSVLANVARIVIDALPNLVEIVAHVPLPNFITQAVANTKMAQDFNLLLNLAALWAVARIIATLFRLMGAERNKVENVFGLVAKGLIILVLLSEGVKFAMGAETIDLFRGLIPFSMERGGDVPGWLANSNLREMAWAIYSTLTGLLVGGWAYISNIRPRRLRKKKKQESLEA